MSSEPNMLLWLTTVLTLAFLALSASNSVAPYPVGYLVMTLSLFSVSLLPFFRSRRTCCSRSSICALLTLSLLIWVIATEVSTGLYPRVLLRPAAERDRPAELVRRGSRDGA